MTEQYEALKPTALYSILDNNKTVNPSLSI